MQTYQKKPQAGEQPASLPAAAVPDVPALDALRAGAAAPAPDMLGHKVDLPGALRARMESSFGADLSGIQLYESQAVADAGASAITQGSRIAFAPGKLDFASTGGKALLGHEISHAVSQARGEVSGHGFLQSHALEARADHEGMLAAMGQPISAAPVGAISDVSAASAAGPMQAKKDKPPQMMPPSQRPRNERLASPTYDSAAMNQAVSALAPEAQQAVTASSRTLDVSNGGRFAFLRGNTPLVKDYAEGLAAAHDGVARDVVPKLTEQGKGLFSVMNKAESAESHGSYKESRGTKRGTNKMMNPGAVKKYQDVGLSGFDTYLDSLSHSQEAIDALRQGGDMYSSFGDYDQTNNPAGMVGGREEALHRAMNDMMLRALGPQMQRASASPSGEAYSADDRRGILQMSQTMQSMQAAALALSMGGDSKKYTKGEAALRKKLQNFYADMGLM
jgi:hypothetical protein